MKNIAGVLGISLLAFSSSVWSSGFYVGAGGGPEWSSIAQDSTIINSNSNIKDKTHYAATGYFGSIFGGYEWVCNRYSLAGEINANASSNEFYALNDEYISGNLTTTKITMNRSYGISLLPGFHYCTTLFYGRLGYSMGNFTIRSGDSSWVDVNRNLNGFRWGLGIRQALTNCLSLQVEYTQVGYNSTNTFVLDNSSGQPTAVRRIYTPQTGQVIFGLVYKFS